MVIANSSKLNSNIFCLFNQSSIINQKLEGNISELQAQISLAEALMESLTKENLEMRKNIETMEITMSNLVSSKHEQDLDDEYSLHHHHLNSLSAEFLNSKVYYICDFKIFILYIIGLASWTRTERFGI